MKKIINNVDNITEQEINRIVKRAKIILINNDNEILICNSKNNYFLLGGHVEQNESDEICLKRELFEEAGISIDLSDMKLFMEIIYLNKDYPSKNVNTKTSANYYYLKSNAKPQLDKISLTAQEKAENFRIEKIKVNDIVEVLTNSLPKSTRKIVVEDTIKVLEEFIKEHYESIND